MDRVVKGNVWQDGGLEPGAVGIREGRIAAVDGDLDGDEVVDVGDAWVLPGAVDPHVHFRDPGHPRKEDFGSGTAAAARAGVTCVLDMPNTHPATTTPEALAAKRDRASRRARVDFGLYAGLTADPATHDLLERATAGKMYLGTTTGPLVVDGLEVVDDAARASGAAGTVVAVHPESQACLEEHRSVLDEAAPDDWDAHLRARPAGCEARAVERIVEAAGDAGGHLHVAHLSTARGVDLVEGTPVTAEASPHHLLLDRQHLARGPRYKMNPPLRDPGDRARLWEAFGAGDVAVHATDHAPHTPAEKDAPVQGAPSGVPVLEDGVPLLLAAVAQGALPLDRVVDAVATAPARRFGLPKGRLAEGYDADLMVVDPTDAAALPDGPRATRAGWTPFEGWTALRPRRVVVRGRDVVRDGEVVGPTGYGRFHGGAADAELPGPRPSEP
jgi:dihydroorotase